MTHPYAFERCLAGIAGGVILVAAIAHLSSCAPSTETVIKGDREVVQVTVGRLLSGDGDGRYFYILRDPATGADYLAVVDAGIIKLEPVPQPQVEKAKP